MDEPTSSTYAALLEELAETHPDRQAAVDQTGRSLTFAELRERAGALASGLDELGVEAGDRVAVLMENRVEWLETMFAAHRLGATVVGVSTWATARDLEYYLGHSGADALVATASFAGTDFASTLDDVLGGELSTAGGIDSDAVPALETVVLLGAERPAATTFAELPAEPLSFETDPNDPGGEALLLYTSGSTSKPKGVPLLHGGLVENGYHIGERMHLTPEDRVWLASPLFWSYGAANALPALLTHGGGLVLQAPFDPDVAFELMAEHDCTVYYGMPNMAKRIIDAEAFDADRLSLRTGTTIGSPEEVELTMDELDVPQLCNVYGSTETYGNCAVTDATLPRSVRLETQGRPLPGQDVKVVDPETGERVEDGEVGEICVGGRITPGYHDNPEQNEAAFDEDGYLKMGDLGRLDSEGRVQFRGRLKNMLKVGGINVSPMEVEEWLLEHPDVDQAFVVGLDDPEKDTVVGAVVVPETESLTEREVHEHCGSLAAYKRPAEVVLADPERLPQTDTGKIQRTDLAALFEDR
jgi:fatty-acyl-CoA synthase